VIYNGGLQKARVRYYYYYYYYCADRRRPGLPASAAALVSSIDPLAIVVDPVNLGPEQDRTVIIQADAFAEHTIRAVRYTAARTVPGSAACTTTGTASRPSPSATPMSIGRG